MAPVEQKLKERKFQRKPANKTGYETGFSLQSADQTSCPLESAVQTGSKQFLPVFSGKAKWLARVFKAVS